MKVTVAVLVDSQEILSNLLLRVLPVSVAYNVLPTIRMALDVATKFKNDYDSLKKTYGIDPDTGQPLPDTSASLVKEYQEEVQTLLLNLAEIPDAQIPISIADQYLELKLYEVNRISWLLAPGE